MKISYINKYLYTSTKNGIKYNYLVTQHPMAMLGKDIQMKKKLFLLASVALGTALVGGTFASWAVTDNADPFSIKVSTGDVTTDDTNYVTLKWGESQSIGNVSNLGLNSIRKAGVLDLRAETSATEKPSGQLTLAIAGGQHLLAKLDVKVYEGNLAASEGVIAPATVSELTPVAFTDGAAIISVNKNEANLFTVAVSLKSDTLPGDITDMDGEIATVTFDWNQDPTMDVVTTKQVYVNGFDHSSKVFAYAWKEGEKTEENAAWPGIEMVPVTIAPGFYTIEIPAKFEKVIFNDSGNNDYEEPATIQTGDIVISSAFAGKKNLFTFTGEGDMKGATSELGAINYHLVGTFNMDGDAWVIDDDNYLMTVKDGEPDNFEIEATFAAETHFKVYRGADNRYFGCASTYEGCGYTLDKDGNLVVPAGTYHINIDMTPIGGNFIYLSAVE